MKRFSQIMLFLVVGVIGTLMVFGKKAPDYCKEQNRSLSKQEYIEKALRSEVAFGNLTVDEGSKGIPGFLEKNPSCCRFSKPKSRGVFERIFNPNVKFIDPDPVSVSIRFELNEFNAITERRRSSKYLETIYFMNGCGRLIKRYTSSESKID